MVKCVRSCLSSSCESWWSGKAASDLVGVRVRVRVGFGFGFGLGFGFGEGGERLLRELVRVLEVSELEGEQRAWLGLGLGLG